MRYFGELDASMIEEKELTDFDSKHFKSPATIADKLGEMHIKDTIKKHFPDHGFLGEEEGIEMTQSDYRWIIDPIDGTKSFTRGIDDWAILLALQYQDEFLVGISCMPVV